MSVARIHSFFFCLAALGCNSIFGVDELQPTAGSATSVASTSVSTSDASSTTAASSSSSAAGGTGGMFTAGGSGGAPPPRRVFVTSDTFGVGEFDSTMGANQLCQQIADDNMNTAGGSWRAWISDATIDAIDNMVSDGPWHTLDDELVFDSKADIVDHNTDDLFHPIVLDQNLNNRDGEPVWTGTAANGEAALFCAEGTSSWSNGSRQGAVVGIAGQTDADWTSGGIATSAACAQGQARVYCFEQ